MAILFALICYLSHGVWVGIAKLKYWSSDDNLGITGVYCINTSEIPSKLSWENFITCYPWRDHRHYGYVINRTFESKLIWYFTGVYIINRILHTCLWIWILSSRVQLDISLVRYRVDHSKIKFVSMRFHVISSISLVCFYSCVRYSFPFGRPEGALKATLSLFERVRLQYIMFWI